MLDDFQPRPDKFLAGIIYAHTIAVSPHKHRLNNAMPVKGLHSLDNGPNIILTVRTVDLMDVVRRNGIEFQDIVIYA